MGMYDMIVFPDDWETDTPIPDELFQVEVFQTSLFETMDVYAIREKEDFYLYRMNPPLYKITTHNEGRLFEPTDDHLSFEDYADYWTLVRNITGYMELTLVPVRTENSYMYELFVTFENGKLDEIIPYKKTHTGNIFTNVDEPKDPNEWIKNTEKIKIMKEESRPVVGT